MMVLPDARTARSCPSSQALVLAIQQLLQHDILSVAAKWDRIEDLLLLHPISVIHISHIFHIYFTLMISARQVSFYKFGFIFLQLSKSKPYAIAIHENLCNF